MRDFEVIVIFTVHIVNPVTFSFLIGFIVEDVIFVVFVNFNFDVGCSDI